MEFNKFMRDLKTTIMEKRNVKEVTVRNYLGQLRILNENRNFRNFGFLRDVDTIFSKLKKYTIGTRVSYLSAISSVLSTQAERPKFKKLYKMYNDALYVLNEKKMTEPNLKQKDKESKNWISWEGVLEIHKDLFDKVRNFKYMDKLNRKQYSELLEYFILSLYTEIIPRRNKDYLDCYIIMTDEDMKLDTDKNYYVIDQNKFIFNKYKTEDAYGQQVVYCDDEFEQSFSLYFQFHPYRGEIEDPFEKEIFPFLVSYKGVHLNNVNSITKVLNKVFSPKKVSSSMLRKIFLTSKYKDTINEMEETATQMAHSTDTAKKSYIKMESHDDAGENTEK